MTSEAVPSRVASEDKIQWSQEDVSDEAPGSDCGIMGKTHHKSSRTKKRYVWRALTIPQYLAYALRLQSAPSPQAALETGGANFRPFSGAIHFTQGLQCCRWLFLGCLVQYHLAPLRRTPPHRSLCVAQSSRRLRGMERTSCIAVVVIFLLCLGSVALEWRPNWRDWLALSFVIETIVAVRVHRGALRARLTGEGA